MNRDEAILLDIAQAARLVLEFINRPFQVTCCSRPHRVDQSTIDIAQ